MLTARPACCSTGLLFGPPTAVLSNTFASQLLVCSTPCFLTLLLFFPNLFLNSLSLFLLPFSLSFLFLSSFYFQLLNPLSFSLNHFLLSLPLTLTTPLPFLTTLLFSFTLRYTVLAQCGFALYSHCIYTIFLTYPILPLFFFLFPFSSSLSSLFIFSFFYTIFTLFNYPFFLTALLLNLFVS